MAFCLGFSGCSPTAESQLDEQKNPHYLAGREKIGALDYKGAIESFERAIEDNPRSALAHFELGVLLETRENDYAGALYHYNKAIKLRPNGHPAETIRQRIPGCKQELVKADSLQIINPTVLKETENLRVENQSLRKQIEALQNHIAMRPPASAPEPASGPGVRDSTPAPVPPSTNGSAFQPRSDAGNSIRGTTPPAQGRPAPAPASGARGRTHTVKTGDTPSSISRQYRVKLTALLAANPSLDPKRLRVGQVLNIPTP